MKKLLIIFIAAFAFTACASVDYRTDQERAQGVVLPEWQIELRKEADDARLRNLRRADDEFWFRDALRRCGNDFLVINCL